MLYTPLTTPAGPDPWNPLRATLLEVVKLLEQQRIPQLAVVNENGIVVGLLEKASVINLLQQKALLKTA